jgi:uncharacterized membrane protein
VEQPDRDHFDATGSAETWHDRAGGRRRPDPDRGAGRCPSARGLPPWPGHRSGDRLRRRRHDRGRHLDRPARRDRRPAGLGAAALYALGVLLQKQALRDVDPFTATWLDCLAGMVACLPFAPGLLAEVRDAPAAATAGILYLGLLPTAIAFATWAYALERMSAGSLSSSSYLVPGIAVLLSWWLLGEVPTPLALVGGALCLIGVAVTRLPPNALLHILGKKSGPRAGL